MANELHTMPLKIERLLSSANVQMLEADEFGVYIKLLCYSWLNAGIMPTQCQRNANAMQRLCGISAECAERCQKNVIDVFFQKHDDGEMRNDTQTQIYSETLDNILRKSSAGKAAAVRRWNDADALPTHCQRIANALPTQCQPNAIQSQSQSQSQIINTEYLSGAISSPPDQTTASAPLLNLEVKAKSKRFDNLIDFDWSIGDWREAIPEDVLSDWRGVYPACNVGWECNKAAMWLRANPTKRKKNYYRFLTGWMARCQESGGTK